MEDRPSAEKGRIYVATMDEETCPSCASRHGVRLLPSDQTHVIPNPYCTSRHGCRCSWEPES